MNKNTLFVAVTAISLTMGAGCESSGTISPCIDGSCLSKNWYLDLDEDGYGDENDLNPIWQTLDPSDSTAYAANNSDCDDAEALNFPSNSEIQDGLDNDCDGVIDEYSIGDAGPAGGIVFYVDGTEQHGLEAAPEDQDDGTGAEWGCFGTDINGADGTAIGTGVENTADILAAQCAPYNSGSVLAIDLVTDYSLNGFNDWFLPSKDELDALYIVNDHLRIYDPANPFVSGFTDNVYWSSSEHSSTGAWGFIFQDYLSRSDLFRVRARAIGLKLPQ